MGEIKIITDGPGVEEALRRNLKFSPLEIGKRDLILIDVNCVSGYSQSRTDRTGLELAREYAENPQNVVILLGLEPESYLRKVSEDFVGLMARANVDFSDIIILNKVLPKYQEIVSGKKQTDSTALAIYDFQKKQKSIAVLRHSISRVDNPGSRQVWLDEVRAAGITGTDEEIIKYVRTWEPDTAGEFQGKYLEGIFVDAYQTLFDEEWVVDTNVLGIVSGLAKEMQKKVFVISDSPKETLRKLLEEAGISWMLLSKYDLRGANLEIVIDNLSSGEFKKMYGIFPQKFIKVTDLLSE